MATKRTLRTTTSAPTVNASDKGLELTGSAPFFSPLCLAGVDIEAARKEEERVMLRDARQWVNSGQIQDIRHAKSGGTALHVAAAKGYVEVLK